MLMDFVSVEAVHHEAQEKRYDTHYKWNRRFRVRRNPENHYSVFSLVTNYHEFNNSQASSRLNLPCLRTSLALDRDRNG
jgi:hypothetical protein